MNLTPQQVETLDQGGVVSIMVDGRNCVLIRRDAYEQDQIVAHEDKDIIAMQAYLADLAPEDWEDASNYE
jgi:hypothetical protein